MSMQGPWLPVTGLISLIAVNESGYFFCLSYALCLTNIIYLQLKVSQLCIFVSGTPIKRWLFEWGSTWFGSCTYCLISFSDICSAPATAIACTAAFAASRISWVMATSLPVCLLFLPIFNFYVCRKILVYFLAYTSDNR